VSSLKNSSQPSAKTRQQNWITCALCRLLYQKSSDGMSREIARQLDVSLKRTIFGRARSVQQKSGHQVRLFATHGTENPAPMSLRYSFPPVRQVTSVGDIRPDYHTARTRPLHPKILPLVARAARTFRPVRAAGGFNFNFQLSQFQPSFSIHIPPTMAIASTPVSHRPDAPLCCCAPNSPSRTAPDNRT